MTYMSARDWCDNNVSKDMFDDFDDWLEACRNEFDNGFELFQNEEFISLLKDSWDEESDNRGEEKQERKEIEIEIERRVEEERMEKVPIPEEPKRIIADRFPEPEPVTSAPIVLQSPQIQGVRILPETGRAPELPRPVFTEKQESRIRGFIRKVFRI